VSDAIGAEVKAQEKQNWTELITQIAEATGSAMELFFEEDYRYLDMKSDIAGYIDYLMKKDEVLQFEKKEQDLIREKAEYFYELFNENLQYAGYSILLFQKRKMKDEVELFLSERI